MSTKCGFVAIMGRPNVGKSSLLNTILGKKVSIISFRPQTTRHAILGIKTQQNEQVVYVDTPGMQVGKKYGTEQALNKVARQSLVDIDSVVFVIEALKWTDEDEFVAGILKKIQKPLIIALNKIDLIPEKERLLSFMGHLHEKLPGAQIIPLSVKKKLQIDVLEKAISAHLVPGPFHFPEDQMMNHDDYFHAKEIVREKLMNSFEKEIPYAVEVQTQSIEDKESLVHIETLIHVKREGQKRIIIGEKGEKLRDIGIASRKDLERFYGKKVCLKLWVKVVEA